MGIRKPTSLRTVFLQFLFMLLFGLLGAVAIPFLALVFSTTIGITTYGDYSEIKANELAPIIAATPDLSEIRIPIGIEYVLLDKNYQVLESTLNENDLEEALQYAKTGISAENLQKNYMFVTREQEYVVLQYFIGSRFTNDWMEEHFLSPELLLYLMILINCIVVSAILTTRLSNSLWRQLKPLFDATEKVSNHNLDFEVGHSKIKEFEKLLFSFSEMKTNLKDSLEKQWETELMQKEQIAALAHDIKTPLTVIQGNADLIIETELDREQRLYIEYILKSAEQMHIYIKTLIDISRAAMGYQLNVEMVNISEYMNYLKEQIKPLCKTKKVNLEWDNISTLKRMKVDKMQIERSIMNVVNNAIEHSEEGSHLYSSFVVKDNYLILSIVDEGKGFSKEALQHAQECFFMDDHSRTSKMHFGMGLYIASSIIKQHGGELILNNSLQTKGAQVIIKIPCN
uniref:histidine kinase n=1 Tax=Eubacterium plexicaudatum ASF492 TaxID=1235802 RepID=N2ADT7_9FIRM